MAFYIRSPAIAITGKGGKTAMSWNDDHYLKVAGGDYDSQEEIERAAANGDVRELSNGNYWDPETKEEYWWDGTKK